MRHSEFTDLFRNLARRHKQIRHNPTTNRRFMRAVVASDPIQREFDYIEVERAVRSELKPGLCVVLTSYEAEYNDNGADQRTKQCFASLLVLDRYKTEDEREAAFDRTEAVGEELMAAALHEFLAHLATRRFKVDDISSDRIARLGDGLTGTRFTFSFTVVANVALAYDETLFDA
jgi:hypothetical protein